MKPVFKNKENKQYNVDGKEVWESRSVAVGVVIFAAVEDMLYVLIEKRSKKMPDGAGLWVVPSGYIDYNENGWDAIRRETYEETSFFIDTYKKDILFDNDKQPFYVHSEPNENRQNIVLWYTLLIDFTKKGLPEEILSYKNSEIDGVEWLSTEKLNSHKWAFNHKERIKMALNKIGM